MDASPAELTVFTIGHSNLSERQFLDLLARYGIELLVDVRSTPYSRFAPQFNRETVKARLHDVGIRYTYAGHQLGGRPTDPTCYKSGVAPEPGANYLAEVDYGAVETRDWYQQGIRRLLDIAREHRTVIMCSEEQPERCHRHHLISRTLLNHRATVWHIRQDGSRVEAKFSPQQVGLFAASGTSTP